MTCRPAASGARSRPARAAVARRSSSSSRSTRSSPSGSATSTTLYEPVPHWNPLDWNVGYIWKAIEDVAPGGTTWPVFVRTLLYVVARDRPLAGDRLPGRVVTPRATPAAGAAAAGRARAAVLDLLPDADVRLDEPARHRRLRGAGRSSAVSIDTLFGALGLMEPGRTGSAASTITVIMALVYGYVPYLILPLLRVARPHRQPHDRGGARPRRVAGRARSGASSCPRRDRGSSPAIVLIALPMFGDFYTPT